MLWTSIFGEDDPKRFLRDPGLALERVRQGELSADDPAQLKQRAREAIGARSGAVAGALRA